MIQVTVQTEDRLHAINNLSAAILACAEALKTNVTIKINDNIFKDFETAIKINTMHEVEKTEIKEI